MRRIWPFVTLLLYALPVQAGLEMYFVHNDHLGIPRVVTDKNREVVWKGRMMPFGEMAVEFEAVTNHRRFPGQRFDIESRLHYNSFRNYDPRTGNYVQSDPIGLAGGLNTYAYARGNPISYSDPHGEAPVLMPFLGGALFDFALQMAMNGGRVECIKWETVFTGGVLAAFSPFSLASVMNKFRKADKFLEKADTVRAGSRAQNRYRNKHDKFNKAGAFEYGAFMSLEGGNELAGSFVFPEKCGCE
jgi:RHS repeat-associated protein